MDEQSGTYQNWKIIFSVLICSEKAFGFKIKVQSADEKTKGGQEMLQYEDIDVYANSADNACGGGSNACGGGGSSLGNPGTN